MAIVIFHTAHLCCYRITRTVCTAPRHLVRRAGLRLLHTRHAYASRGLTYLRSAAYTTGRRQPPRFISLPTPLPPLPHRAATPRGFNTTWTAFFCASGLLFAVLLPCGRFIIPAVTRPAALPTTAYCISGAVTLRKRLPLQHADIYPITSTVWDYLLRARGHTRCALPYCMPPPTRMCATAPRPLPITVHTHCMPPLVYLHTCLYTCTTAAVLPVRVATIHFPPPSARWRPDYRCRTACAHLRHTCHQLPCA